MLITILMAVVAIFGTVTEYEDGSTRAVINWTAPECPDINDEPCYVAVITDAETGEVRIVTGP